MPDDPGALHRAAEAIKRHGGNIVRVDYDRRIDPHVVFFEIDADEGAPSLIKEDLAALGYLQTSLSILSFLKFQVYLPDRAGSLFDLLEITTGAKANIAFLDYDTRGRHPDALTVALTADNDAVADRLLNELRGRYRLEILEYDSTGRKLDDNVFYIRLAQELREIIGEAGDEFLLRLLQDINHVVQELTSQGKDPRMVFDSVLKSGRALMSTTGQGFYADVQTFRLSNKAALRCFQLPCGGSIYLLSDGRESVMFDTGFGIYHGDVLDMMQALGADLSSLRGICITHADADHAGATGMFDVPTLMHPGSEEIIKRDNRAYGSKMQDSVLGAVYTTLINLFSRFAPPTEYSIIAPIPLRRERGLAVIGEMEACGLTFQILETLGGHQFGHLAYMCRSEGILLTGDCLMNFDSFTPERSDFASLAKNLMNSVNVDSSLASQERAMLLEIAAEMDEEMKQVGRRALICGGHGAVSVLNNGRLESASAPERYSARS